MSQGRVHLGNEKSQQERTRYLRQSERLKQDSAQYLRQLKRLQRELYEQHEEIRQLSSENIILAQSVLSPEKRVIAACQPNFVKVFP